MANVLIQNLVQASNIDALNRTFIVPSATTLENGDVIVSGAYSTTAGQSEVFTCTVPTAKATGVWIAYEPEVVVTAGKYKGLDPDVRNFTLPTGTIFSGFKPMVGDILTYTAIGDDTFANGDTDAQIASNGAFVWNSSALTDSFNMKLLDTVYISIPDGVLGSRQRVTAYKFEVTCN